MSAGPVLGRNNEGNECMKRTRRVGMFLAGVLAVSSALAGCATTNPSAEPPTGPSQGSRANLETTYEKDRASILAMAGDFMVTFDFTETVPVRRRV